MERIDSFSKCTVPGCVNLGENHKRINGKIFRRKLCSKHKRIKYGMPTNYHQSNVVDRFKKKGHCNKCMICGWEGPCDVHRKIPGGSYSVKNMISTCPNCHRLVHRGLLTIPQHLLDIDLSGISYKGGESPFKIEG